MNARVADFIIAALISLGSIFLLGQLKDIPREGYIFPGILLYGMIFCSAILFFRALLKSGSKKTIHVFKDVPFGKWMVVVTIFILYVIGIFHIGFFTSTFLVSSAITLVLSGEHWKKAIFGNLVFAITLTIIFYLFFVKLMMVRFPDALFF